MRNFHRPLVFAAKAVLFLTICALPAAAQSILGGCLYSLDPTSSKAFSIGGATSITSGCSIIVESTASNAFDLGDTETLYLGNHAKVGVVGGSQLNGNSIIDTMSNQQVQPVTIASPGDPLASVPAPTEGTIVSSSPVVYNVGNPPPDNTLTPGVYCGGVSITSSNGTEYTMSPGTYIMAGGGFSITSTADVVGTGITIYNTSSAGWGCSKSYSYTPISINGQAKLKLSAPTSGPLAGVLLFGDRNGCATRGSCIDNINGKASAAFTGALYFKSDELLFTGNSTTGGCMEAVADTIAITGHSTFGSQGCSVNPVTVTLTPSTVVLYGSQQQAFSAAVTNTYNTAVTWSSSPAGVGSIDSSGLYSAPPTVTTQQAVTITATSQADDMAMGSATITLSPPIPPSITWAVPAPITYGTALSASQLDAIVNAPGTLTYSQSAGTMLTAGTHTLTVTFTPANPNVYTPATASVVLTVNRATPSITWAPPAAIIYGTALSGIQLDATANVQGAFTYSPVAGTVLRAGSQTLSAMFAPADAVDYTTATAAVVLTVNPATPQITWTAPAAITYGTPLSGTQLDATASVPGTFAYSPGAGAVLEAGTQSLSVSFTPSDAVDYTSATANVPLTVTQATPVITWAAPAAIAYGTALSATQLDATANVPGTFVFSPAAGDIPPVGAQTLSVTFTPTDAVNYTSASASVPLTVNPQHCTTNGYSYGRAITIDHSKIPNTDQPNFPFLFDTTDPKLATVANGGHVANASGYDIVFTSDPGGQNPLTFEMEEYNAVTGQVVAWVKIPTLSHTADTVIYMFYGNDKITAPQQNPTGVWDQNYVGVWHVPNGSQLSLADSTSNANNATNNGAIAAAGQIDGGMSTDGITYATIGTPASLANLARGNATFSAWVNPAVPNGSFIMGKDDRNISSGWTLGLDYTNRVDFSVIFSQGNFDLRSSQPVPSNQWSYVVVTLAGSPTQSQATIYINGIPSGSNSGGYGQTTDDSAQIAYLANSTFGDWSFAPINGLTDEFRISNTIRSPDWIATEYANQSSPSTFYNVSAEGISISPLSAVVYQGESQQFTADLFGSCSNSVTWTASPAEVGNISQSGLYTAPATVTSPQTVTITASGGAASASATITLMPPVVVSITPSTATIANGSQQQQFTASITNSSNPALTWSISPAGEGTVDQNGLYTAPAILTAGQVSVTATSQADSTKSASAIVTLAPLGEPPPICAGNGYSFTRAIVIDHNQVPNTDQANFPFLFNATDPAFAVTARGGHMENVNAFDLIFTSDPAGRNPLNYELEQYNPVTGQIIAWIQIPTLSHNSDTVIYVFYGNAAISSSQQNSAAVWDANYKGVWHVPNGSQLSLLDSTINGNNGTNNGALATTGEIDGGLSTDGTTFATIGTQADLANLDEGTATYSAWIKPGPDGHGVILGKEDPNESTAGWVLWEDWQHHIGFEGIFGTYTYVYVSSTDAVADNTWSYVTVSVSGSPTQGGTANLYINGVPEGTATVGPVQSNDDSAQPLYLGRASWGWRFLGAMDEFRISNAIRSSDWITAEYNNQKPSSSFFTLYPENFQGVAPTAALLYASQVQQFSALGTCATPSVAWSMPDGSPGTLTAGGLYTAPDSISTPQSVTVTATSQADGSTIGTSTISLMPPIAVSVAPSSLALQVGQTQQFTATVANTNNTAVSWTVTPAGMGTISATGLYQAPAMVPSIQTVTITATSQADPTKSASATISVQPIVTVKITPTSGTLFAKQTLQFDSSWDSGYSNCGGATCVSWSISPSNLGSISWDGQYTAPSSIPALETVTVIGSTVQGGVSASASAVITLLPNAPAISLTPPTATLTGGQTLQFSASVANASSNVTWSMSPATGSGTLSASGFYTAPPVVTSQQTVTITAVSQAIPSLTASATLTLLPSDCAAKSYAYERSITIDHTKVPDSDQSNFPFYFAVTDPLLATTANGGHMASPNGYDLEFSLDPAGFKTLNYQLEQYNPVTGQVVAWVQVPNLSHSQDTVIYMFYGNANVTAPQQSLLGVWDSNYAAVYQFDNLQSGFVPDSSGNGNQAWTQGLQQSAGFTGGAANFDGASSFLEIPETDFASFPVSGSSGAVFNSTFAIWFKTTSSGVILGQLSTAVPGSDFVGGWIPALYIDVKGYLRANFFNLKNAQQIVSANSLNDNNWHHAVLTFNTNQTNNTIGPGGGVTSTTSGIETVYVDGQVIGSQKGLIPTSYNSVYSYYLGTGYAQSWAATPASGNQNPGWFYFNGSLDQVEISSTARSNGWVQSEYNNQSSPSTFFTTSPEAGPGGILNPTAVTLYGSQAQQFTVMGTGMCNAGQAVWSMPEGSAGTLSPTGLYTAPGAVESQQEIPVTATTLGTSSAPLTAEITLMPPVEITVTPGSATVPVSGSQQFTATVTNASNTGVTWTLSPAGMGSISPTGVYTAPAVVMTSQAVEVTATSVADRTKSASVTVTLLPGGFQNPIAVNLSPAASTIYGGQSQQLTATVTNTSNSAVSWAITPANLGTIDGTGLYTAPATVTSQQTVTITATSQQDPTKSAFAMITLSPSACAAGGYAYERSIVIDHTKVPNTDQANFPILFNTTDPSFASTANGGHVSSANGYDIIFSTDPNGNTKLDHEIEQYNPVTGQIVAWVRVPLLSHATDTTLYIFYGNPGVSTPQQNGAGVWDTNYLAVYHLSGANGAFGSDSTANAYSGSANNVIAAAGVADGAGAFDGTSSYIQLPPTASPDFTTNPNAPDYKGPASFAIWFKTASSGVVLGQEYGNYWTPGGNPPGWYIPALYVDTSGHLDAEFYGPQLTTSQTYNDNNWHFADVTYDGTTETLYVDGSPSLSTQNPIQNIPGSKYLLGTGESQYYPGTNGSWFYFPGTLDEMNVSRIARSSDWIKAQFNNESSPSTFYSLSPENPEVILPATATLFSAQSAQFTVAGACVSTANWSLPGGGPGTLTADGLYTAPSQISEEQTVTVTAASIANPAQTASGTVTLMPTVGVAVTPASATLTQNQTQLFTAAVTNTTNPAVTWSITPSSLGSIDQTGAYTAPSSITTQQTVTITATSQAEPSVSASAMVTLAPNTCASSGFGYQRVIVIDHTKVANTDQNNFPFLFNTTDRDLASVDNGGHVANPKGYDIIFSADPNGHTRLDFEIEQYSPSTGQLVAWIRIPTLSHSSDTVIYAFYGNPAITVSQANPAGVWDSNYQAIYHLGNLPASGIVADSTLNANNGAHEYLTPSAGQIDGAASLNGYTSFLEIPPTAFPNYPTGVYSNIGVNTAWSNTSFNATFGIWFKTASWGGLLDQTAGDSCATLLGICLTPSPEQPGTDPYGSWGSLLDINFNGNLEGRSVGPTTQIYNDNNWHYATITFADGVNKLYADGQLVATGQQGTFGFSPNYAYFVGTEDVETDTGSLDSQPWQYVGGQMDEVNVSSIARSSDWIQTQYNNQSSPSTFYSFYPANAIQVAPSAISLYASQSEQFIVPGTCDTSVQWSLPPSSPGTLSGTGLYTAPAVIPGQQTVTVSATSQSNGASLGSAVVTLLPPPQPLALAASVVSPYLVGSTQSFTATLLDPDGAPRVGIVVNFAVNGVNGTTGSAATDTNGEASFAYSGSNSGTDSVQATASVDGVLQTSNTVSATWLTPPPVQAPTISLLPQASPGRGALMGAFTDSSGNLIEPIVIGSAARTFITPAGATQLQLGINDNYYEDNGGAGFLVAVNGVKVTVPSTAMPWNWKTGALNNNYQFGVNDGTSPIVAAPSLTAGQIVTIAYQSGTITTDNPLRSLVNADGESGFITGTQLYQGTYFPTMYTTGTSYPQGQPITVFAVVTDAAGAPIPNVPVTLSIAGANPGQYQATSDATGTASFLYTGQYAGNDSLIAQAALSGTGSLTSNETAIAWTNYPTPPPVGSLSLNYILSVVNSQSFSSFAKDASGNRLSNVNVGFYVKGVDNFQSSSNTNNIGQASFSYYHTQSGSYKVVAVDSVGRNVLISPAYTGTWTVSQANPVSSGGAISFSVSASAYVTMPNPLQLNATVTDSAGLTTTDTWSKISGPGDVTFADPTKPVTTATFSQAGTYVLQLFATDSVNSGWVQVTVIVLAPSVATTAQGWIGAPLYGAPVSGIVPITLASGVSIASGTLSYAPTNDPNSATVINANVSGSGQIGALDTTQLANGSYWIQMQATDTSGQSEYSLVLVNVTGDYKPGRVTTTVTDLVVPATGLPIQIQRTYDSLNAGTVGDFGYGWNLGINVDLVVDPSGNVTFTLGGQRKTFYLTPQMPPCTIAGCLFPYYFVAFTPEPGLHGSLTDSEQGCPLDLVVPYGSLWECYGNGTQYNPPGYIYTDPSGTQYNISAGGALQSITDRNGNGLTITPNGITSTTGLTVPFVRDAQGRITQITDPEGNVYTYGYDTSGNLATVTYPTITQPSTYTYAANHYYLSGTDFRNNPLPSTGYYGPNDTDANGLPLNGRLHTVTDALGETTTYDYDLVAHSTAITYPPDAAGNIGKAAMVYNSHGNLLSSTDPLGHTIVNAYDASFNLISVTDPLGHTTSYTYDANGNRTSVTYPATATSTNTTTHATYGPFGAPLTFTDENGNARTFTYDANGLLTAVADTVNGQTAIQATSVFSSNGLLQAVAVGADLTKNPSASSVFTYDANGDVASATDPLGRTTLYSYDALGRVVTMTRKAGSSSAGSAESPSAASQLSTRGLSNIAPATTERGSAPLRRSSGLLANHPGRQALVLPRSTPQAQASSSSLPDCSPTPPQSYSVVYTYSAMSGVESEVDSLGRTGGAAYDANGNIISYTDANRNTYLYTYDSLNRLTHVTLPTHSGYSFTYDYAGHVIDTTDPEGHVRHNVYDLAGHLTSVTLAYGTDSATTTNFTYYNDGKLQTATDAAGHSTNYTYDAAGNLTNVTKGDVSVQYAYDNARNRISATDGKGNTTTFHYDARQRLDKIGFADQTSQTVSYDAANNVTSVVDQAGHTVDYGYNTSNALISVTQANSPFSSANALKYCRDGMGNVAWVADANGHVTSQTADALGRPTSLTYPDGSSGLTASYDGNSNLVSLGKTGTSGTRTAAFTYDSLNRLTAETPDSSYGEPAIKFTYTANGLVSTMTDASGQTTYNYDPLDRLTSKTTPAGTLNYTYNAVGNVATMSSSGPGGVSVSYTYDELNRLSTVVDNNLPSGQNTTSYSYDPASNLATATYPNGLQAIFGYDQLNRLSQTTTAVSGYQYQRDPNGNILTAAEANNRTVSYSYDGLDQLTGESVANDPAGVNGSVSYSPDPVGNRLSDTSTLQGVTSGSWSFNADDEPQSEGFDGYGDTVSTGGNTYSYNSWLKLTSMNGGQVTLAYNGFGQLVAKTTQGVTTQYLIDDLSPTGYPQVVEELVGGAATRTYTYGLERISQLQTINNLPTASFYQYDGRGTVRMLTNAAGTVTDTYQYDAFGNLIGSAGNTPNVYLYRGERYDSDLGLYYLRARWYNPVSGRFMTRDPYQGSLYDPASLHRYNYARSNPVNFVDPSGRAAAADYALNLSNFAAKTAAITAFGEMINCGYFSLASSVHLVGEHVGQQITQLKDFWTQCNAQITAQKFLTDFSINVVFGAALEGIGPLLEGTEGGELPLLSDAPKDLCCNTPKPRFYVTPEGTAIPSTGYRAIGADSLAKAMDGDIMSPSGTTYITFTDIGGMSPTDAGGALQIPYTPVAFAEFDTLQLVDDLNIPMNNWNQGTTPEPFTTSFPQFGPGGATQAITSTPISGYGIFFF